MPKSRIFTKLETIDEEEMPIEEQDIGLILLEKFSEYVVTVPSSQPEVTDLENSSTSKIPGPERGESLFVDVDITDFEDFMCGVEGQEVGADSRSLTEGDTEVGEWVEGWSIHSEIPEDFDVITWDDLVVGEIPDEDLDGA